MAVTLFSPLELGGITLPNRIVISPMCQYSADDGSMNDWHLVHLGHLAYSGAGLMILEATHVTREGRITHNCAGLYSEHNEAAMKRVDALREEYVELYESSAAIALDETTAQVAKVRKKLKKQLAEAEAEIARLKG